MQFELTAVYRKVSEGYVAFVEELPGANSQGSTLDEARAATFAKPWPWCSKHHIETQAARNVRCVQRRPIVAH